MIDFLFQVYNFMEKARIQYTNSSISAFLPLMALPFTLKPIPLPVRIKYRPICGDWNDISPLESLQDIVTIAGAS